MFISEALLHLGSQSLSPLLIANKMKNSSAKNQFDKARKGPPNGSNNRAEVAAVLARFAVHELSSALHRKDFRGAVSAGKKVHHAKKKEEFRCRRLLNYGK